MTNPNNQTNGASLEDCHTNFFALTDLCGIKWRKVVWGEWGECSDVLEDPVLGSYVRCLAADILCVWRRVSTPPPHHLHQRSGGPQHHESGLFDQLGLPAPPAPPTHHPPFALHTAKELWIFWYGEEPDLSHLISPVLLTSEGEQGSWEGGLSYECRSLLFKALHNLIERCLLSRDFVRLGKWYVQPYDSTEKMIEKSGHLSFSFDFFVHGESTVCASVDVRQHPPVRTLLSSHLQQAQAALHSPPPVQVILAPFGLAGTLTGQCYRSMDPPTQRLLEGWRQFYPIDKSTTVDSADLPPAVEVLVGGLKMRYPSSYVLITDLDESTSSLFNNQLNHTPTTIPHPPHKGTDRGGLLAERVWQESCVAAPPNGTPPTPGQWNFADPTRKQTCSCSCKRSKGQGGGGGGIAVFHRRPPTPPAAIVAHVTRVNCTSSGQTDSVPMPSVGSPTSGAPSPTPASVPPPPDPTMPTLSPQPPPNHHHSNNSNSSPLDDKVVSTPTDFNAPKSVSNQVLSPYGENGVKCERGVKTPMSRTPGGPPCSAPTPPPMPPVQYPKRPMLTSSDYEEALNQEHQPSNLLYDYSTLEAWLNHPVKRFKPTPQPPPPLQTVFKQEPQTMVSVMEVDGNVGYVPRGAGDPYEFDEEGLAGVRMDPFKRAPNIKEEDKGLVNGTSTTQGKMSSGNLFTSEGLQVSYDDLDQMFDQSEDTFGDETLQVTTPPSSNKGASSEECGVTNVVRGGGGGVTACATTGILRPEELSKMFPTPPSLEHNPVSSPCPPGGSLGDTPPDSTTPLQQAAPPPSVPPPPPPPLGSPHHEPIQDWSYVFRPPVMAKLVGSSKYAPLSTLPSHSLTPVSLPSSCVYKPSWSFPHHQDKQNAVVPSGGRSGTSSPPGLWNGGGGQVNRGGVVPPATTPQPQGPPSLPPPPQQVAPPQPQQQQQVVVPYSPAAATTPHPSYPTPKPMEPPSPTPPEADSLVVVVLLTDTALNIFRDHNFDSCTLCVCNAGQKVVGNIQGGDAGMYLPIQSSGGNSPFPMSPSMHFPIDEEPIRCNCGFSAVVNRRLSHRSGLFIEDEYEITGFLEDPGDRENSGLNGAVMELMQQQCLVMNSMSNALYRAASQYRPLSPLPAINLLGLRDGNHLSAVALEQGRLAATNQLSMCKMEEIGCVRGSGSVGGIHRWGFLRAAGPPCNQDIVRMMKQLQPLLQDAIQKKCTTRLWEAPTVSGPLTWRQFHRLAGRGADDRCEPQPIPSIIAGREKDWVSLAPYALHLWEKLLLEPYSYSRDVAYVVVAPDNEFILQKVRMFFRELSTMYEVCRLGRHCPITKVLRDGILRVGKTAAVKLANEPIDDWFSLLGDNSANLLKLYAQACRYHLAPHLSQIPIDRTLLDPPEPHSLPRTPMDRPSPSPRSEQNNESKSQDNQDDCGNTSGNEGYLGGGGSLGGGQSASNNDDDETDPPAIVVYLVEPFTLASDSSELQKLACVALLRAFNTVQANLPENVKSNITMQIISLESIVELSRSSDTDRRGDHMRTLALSVFSQCRRLMTHHINVKALTGFGTAAGNDNFLKNKDDGGGLQEKNRAPYKIFSPAYVLSLSRDKALTGSGSGGGGGGGGSVGVGGGGGESHDGSGVTASDHCSVLYVSYCLSEDQRWLLATATDEQGLLLETVTINVHIPNRSRRRKASARRTGLQKLMDFMLGIMSQSVTPWRLVVGRVGRIGHGELKGWSWLLSRKSLLRASKHLKEICGQCNLLYPNDVPCILSACLVSLEPDSALRLMPDQFTPDERFSQASVKCQLSTPHDVTATHILVFPTSATSQSSQTAFHEQHINGPELGDAELLSMIDDDIADVGDIFSSNDIFSTAWEPDTGALRSPTGSPTGRGRGHDSAPGSPTGQGGLMPHQHSPYSHSVASRGGDSNEEVGTLLQQPLALGYLVSTAPTGKMPRWFWSACPHLESVCPAFLKNALHLHSAAIQQNSEEILQQQNNVSGHPLDSQYTTDVLRYVLEGYNALSWLALDANTHDRLSCLPVHVQVLMQLYHMTSALV